MDLHSKASLPSQAETLELTGFSGPCELNYFNLSVILDTVIKQQDKQAD